MQKFQINRQCSNILRLVNAGLLLIALTVLATAAYVAVLPPWFVALLSLVLVWESRQFVRFQAKLTAPDAIVSLTYTPTNAAWALHQANGKHINAQISVNSILLPAIILLSFRCRHRKRRLFILSKDNVNSATFKQTQRLLRYNKVKQQ